MCESARESKRRYESVESPYAMATNLHSRASVTEEDFRSSPLTTFLQKCLTLRETDLVNGCNTSPTTPQGHKGSPRAISLSSLREKQENDASYIGN